MPRPARLRAVVALALAAYAHVASADPAAVAARFPSYIDGDGRLQLGTPPAGTGLNMNSPRLRVDAQQSPRLDAAAASNELHVLIRSVALQHGLDPALLHAIIQVESGFNPDAVSPRGAVGLMQLMPATAQRFAVRDRRDIAQNLQGGAAYLAWLLRHFNADVRLAVAAYNAGEGAVHRAGNRVPAWPETQAYVRRVTALYGAAPVVP